ncbi:RND multidrug efflux transporter Acriflavin resistance protein OS=Crocosphaera watsonii WH 0401 GN=CWATWH0401_2611 PE=4 SV=1 [Gemmata massiliana]|uniref:RND multidrug efflux transporter Acriflavin resistance protein n=1 Tax=Gemmata massiliana TaxID=1210884 RepID=A0A6P2D357_9BACT|nr:TIGR04372 family glycosyltransferase [Gemmata massiliana]VTR93882.1 RND multidrug efflux transporter Acriflavin resistance protein OS=Crocosphaera watsonii WH 0401 GN=CWATWH0401_2611 PE=4 SV=1 [Gemmata massiliana]
MAIPVALTLFFALSAAVALKAARSLLRERPEYFAVSLPRFGLAVGRRLVKKALGRVGLLPVRAPEVLPELTVAPPDVGAVTPEPASVTEGAAGTEPLPDAEIPIESTAASADLGAVAPELVLVVEPTPDTETGAETVPGFRAQIEALDQLYCTHMNDTADHTAARAVIASRCDVQHQYARHLGFDPSEVLLLNEEWLVNIGHMALLDLWVKMARLGWGQWKHLVLVAPSGRATSGWTSCRRTANEAYLDYWRGPFTAVVTDPDLCEALYPFTHNAGHTINTLVPLPDGSCESIFYAGSKVQEAWERENRAPLLKLTEADAARGRDRLREMGLPDGAWYVCVQARTPGYHEAGAYHQSHRDADIDSYWGAIEEITDRGGWVIRVGDASMEPISPRPQVIDYAVGPHKSDWMDVFLLGSCRFYLGGTSGLSHVPPTFGVPVALVNWISFVLPFYSARDRFIPKLIWSERENRLLTFPEQCGSAVRTASYARPYLDQLGLRVVANTPDEIQDLVGEMFDVLEGRGGHSTEDEHLQSAFDAVAAAEGFGRTMQIGGAFLRTHQALLPGAELLVRRAG